MGRKMFGFRKGIPSPITLPDHSEEALITVVSEAAEKLCIEMLHPRVCPDSFLPNNGTCIYCCRKVFLDPGKYLLIKIIMKFPQISEDLKGMLLFLVWDRSGKAHQKYRVKLSDPCGKTGLEVEPNGIRFTYGNVG